MNQALPTSNNSGCLPWVGLILSTCFLLFFSWRLPGIIDEGVLLTIWWLCFRQVRKQFSFVNQFTRPSKQATDPVQKNNFKSESPQGQIIDIEAEED